MNCIKCNKKYVSARIELCPECQHKYLSDTKEDNKEIVALKGELANTKANLQIALDNNEEASKILKKIKSRLTTKNLKKGSALDEISSDLKYIHKLLGGVEWED